MKKWMTLLLALVPGAIWWEGERFSGGATQEEVDAWGDGLYRGRHLQDGEF